MVTRKVVVSPVEIAAYYEENKADFVADRTVHLGLLVLPFTADVKKIEAAAQAGEFEAMAAEYSIGPNPKKGGDIGLLKWDELTMEWRAILANMAQGCFQSFYY